MNLGTAITLLIVGVLLFFALRSIVRTNRKGSSACAGCSCGCGAGSCTSCDTADQMMRNLETQA